MTVPGVDGNAVLTTTLNDAVAVPHPPVALTLTVPDVDDDDHVVVILLVPCPAVIVTLAGTVHVYVTPAWFGTE